LLYITENTGEMRMSDLSYDYKIQLTTIFRYKIIEERRVSLMLKPEYTGEVLACLASPALAMVIIQSCTGGPFLFCKWVAVGG